MVLGALDYSWLSFMSYIIISHTFGVTCLKSVLIHNSKSLIK
jgi:hypothetical protein